MSASFECTKPSFQQFNLRIHHRILLNCSPFDLYTLSLVNRSFYTMINEPQAVFFELARQNIADLPKFAEYRQFNPFFGTWNERSFTNFTFGETECTHCGQLGPEEVLDAPLTFCLPAFRARLHTPECHESFLQLQLATITQYHRTIPYRSPLRCVRMDAHRRHYVYRLPSRVTIDMTDCKFLRHHIQASDNSVLKMGLATADSRPDTSALTKTEQDQRLDAESCDIAARNFAYWRKRYIPKRQSCITRNLTICEAYAEKDNQMAFAVMKETATVRRLVQSFSRDLELITPSVWRLNRPAVLREYRKLRKRCNSGTPSQASTSSSSKHSMQKKSHNAMKRLKQKKKLREVARAAKSTK